MPTREATDAEAWSMCVVHDRKEVIPPDGAYRICLECGHVYPTPADLVAAWNEAIDEMIAAHDWDPPPAHRHDADGITFCQACMHDF